MMKIGIVGGGAMGGLHARVVSAHPAVTLHWVADPDPGVRGRLSGRYPTMDLPGPADLRGLDGLIVASPTRVHAEWCRAAISEGVPFLVEKPLSTLLGEVEAVTRAAMSAGVPFTVGFVERFNPAVMAAREVLEGPIGYFYAIRHSPYGHRVGVGVDWDLMIHDLDLALTFIESDVDSVTGLLIHLHPTSPERSVDIAEAGVRFRSGAVASLSASRVAQRKVRSLTIGTLDRSVEVDLLRQDVTVYRHVLEQAMDEGPGYRQETVIEIPHISSRVEPLVAQLEHFIRLIKGEVDPLGEAERAIRTHRVMTAIESAAI